VAGPATQDIDLSPQVRRLDIVRATDWGMAYIALQVVLLQAVSLVVDPFSWTAFAIDIAALGIGGCCLFVGLRNIGSITSRTWQSYTVLLWVLMPILLVLAALMLLAITQGDENEATVMSLFIFLGGLGWCAVTLAALFRLRKMKLGGLNENLQQLAQTMSDDGRVASEAIDLSQVQRVNKRKGMALGAIGVAVLIVSAFVWHHVESLPAFQSLSARQQWDAGRLSSVVDGLGFFLLIRMRRYFQIDADALLRSDTRAPILFLRSFEDEEKLTFAQSGQALFDYSLETRLSRHFMHFGPFVAVGSPQDELPQLGAARARLSEDEWRGRVRQWMRSSQVILIYAGSTYWINWELTTLARRGHMHKVVLLIPPRRGWATRSRKVVDDIRARLTCVRGALQDTPWSAALASLQPEKNLRALLFRPDGSITTVRSKPENREAYHLAVLVGHHLLRTQPRVPLLRLKSSPGTTPERWPIYGGITRIGAAQGNEVALAQDDFVSAEHARIECDGNGLAIVDMGSRNGTFVNGAVLHGGRRAIKAGDEIGVGHSMLEVQAG
jgi:FHA domain